MIREIEIRSHTGNRIVVDLTSGEFTQLLGKLAAAKFTGTVHAPIAKSGIVSVYEYSKGECTDRYATRTGVQL